MKLLSILNISHKIDSMFKCTRSVNTSNISSRRLNKSSISSSTQNSPKCFSTSTIFRNRKDTIFNKSFNSSSTQNSPKCFSTSTIFRNRNDTIFNKSFNSYSIQNSPKHFSTSTILNNSNDNLDEENEFKTISEEVRINLTKINHKIFVIQPFIKWGEKKKRNTTREFMLEESKSLVNSIQGWSVTGSTVISLLSLDKKSIFGKGNLELLKETIQNNKENITAIFVSIDVLKLHQQRSLQAIFGLPVFDRYMLVIQIFKSHAFTKEANLQIAIAELPYMWTRYRNIEDTTNMNLSKEILDRKKDVLMEREQKLKKELNKLKEHRELLRNGRKKLEFPTIAVVGYTNCGKTTLIKALTNDKKMIPRNQLFATLDITTHEGILPNNIKVLYIDTIGFISNIPTNLLEPFKVTLEDAMLADIIIHIVDISNPDYIQQKEHVDKTLKTLQIEQKLLDTIILVGNKIDKVPRDDLDIVKEEGYDLVVSATKGTGLAELCQLIQDKLMEVTSRLNITMRVRTGGPEYTWLHKNTTVSNVREDETSAEHLFVDVVMTQVALSKFKHIFISAAKKKKN